MDIGLLDLFYKGGGFMYAILLCGIIACVIIIERLLFFLSNTYNYKKSIEIIEKSVDNKKPLERKDSNPLIRISHIYLRYTKELPEKRANVIQREANKTIQNYEKGLSLLDIIARNTPLIGLLGTVWGMVLTFSTIESLGDSIKTADFAGGIWSGLLTTVFALIVSIVIMFIHYFYDKKVEKLVNDMNNTLSFLDEWHEKN